MSGAGTTKTEAKLQALRDGVATVIPATGSLQVDGTSMTQPQILAKLDGTLSLFPVSAAAKSAATAAVAAVKNALPGAKTFEQQLVDALTTFFGKASPQLQKFGIAAPKTKAVPNLATKALAAQKRRNTRKARGTGGKKQKKAIQPNSAPVTLTLASGGAPANPASPPGEASVTPTVTTPPAK